MKIICSITLGLKTRFLENTTLTQSINQVAIDMNLITQYEQGYLSLSDFINEFPNSISKSQEALCGSECVEFYVAIRNSTLETGCARTCLFVIKSYYSLKKVCYHFTSLLSCCIILIIPIDTTWHITRRVFMKGKERKRKRCFLYHRKKSKNRYWYACRRS